MSRQPITFARDQFEGPSLRFVLSVVVVDVGPREAVRSQLSQPFVVRTLCVHSFVLASRNLINENWTGWNAFINTQQTTRGLSRGGRIAHRTRHAKGLWRPRSTGPRAHTEPGSARRLDAGKRDRVEARVPLAPLRDVPTHEAYLTQDMDSNEQTSLI